MVQTNDDRVSVVMPCFNAERTVRRSVEAALRQTHRDFELVLVDDGSRDGTWDLLLELAKNEPRLIVLRQTNSGPGAARNAGLSRSSGAYIAFLDSDDEWEPRFLELMLEALKQRPDAAIAYCGWQNVYQDGRATRSHIPPDYELTDKLRFILQHCPWPIHGALTRRDVITQAGGFNPTLTSCMDYDLWLRIAARSTIVLVPQILATYHHHGGAQITSNKARLSNNQLAVQLSFIAKNADLVSKYSRRELRDLIYGGLLQRGYEAYWNRDLEAARAIFRTVLMAGYGSAGDLKYVIPSLMPIYMHKALIAMLDNGKVRR